MARTIDTIYQEIIVEKTNQPTLKYKLLNEDGTSTLSTEQDLLTRLTSNSKVAIWKLWAYTTAVVIWTQEKLWDLFKVEVETIKANSFVGSLTWWESKAKEFQYGDTLVVDPITYAISYATLDIVKQIIEHSACIEFGGKVYLKVRRLDIDILSVPELEAFKSYVNSIKFAGTQVVIYNLNADDLKLNYEVFYNPIIDEAIVKAQIESAVNNYISNIPFNGELDINALNVLMKSVNGVKAVRFISGYAKNGANAYTQFDNYYTSVAGYCNVDVAYPLSTTITYTKKY